MLDLVFRAQTSLAKVQTPLFYSLLADAKQEPSMAAVRVHDRLFHMLGLGQQGAWRAKKLAHLAVIRSTTLQPV